MPEWTLAILFAALVTDWFFGDPERLWSKIPHPVVLFGKAVDFADKRFNIDTQDNPQRLRNGAVTIVVLVLLSILAALIISEILSYIGPAGLLAEIFLVFVLLAQKSLIDHVRAVSDGLMKNGIEGGREAIGMIVGRDPETLDRNGILRAAIETLAENFSDGVVAPALWYGVFGLPGIFAYKMINTADSMTGYKTDRYLHFGKTAAHMDDLANWLPARFSALLIVFGALVFRGTAAARASLATALQDSGLHRSPNAGWPEAAMAGALDIALGGPRNYPGETVQQAFINGSGRMALQPDDIENAISVVRFSCFGLMGIVAGLFILL